MKGLIHCLSSSHLCHTRGEYAQLFCITVLHALTVFLFPKGYWNTTFTYLLHMSELARSTCASLSEE